MICAKRGTKPVPVHKKSLFRLFCFKTKFPLAHIHFNSAQTSILHKYLLHHLHHSSNSIFFIINFRFFQSFSRIE